VFPPTDVVHFLADEFAGLRRWCLAGPPIPSSAFERGFLWHELQLLYIGYPDLIGHAPAGSVPARSKMRQAAEPERFRCMTEQRPDIVFLDADRRSRALIRAQLIEDGFEVVATESWAMMRRHLRPGSQPQLALVDLKDLADPQDVLRDLRLLMKPERVLVLSAIGTIPREDIDRLGFHVMPRPFVIEDVVREVRKVTATRSG
jgi:hypothetical protein